MNITEKWNPIGGYEGLYECSSEGRIRSMPRVRDHGDSRSKRILKGRSIKGWINASGYKCVALSKDGVVAKFRVHNLICNAFHQKPDWAECANHRDGNKLNNAAENLEHTTYSENNKHAFRTGLKPPSINPGMMTGTSKMTDAEVIELRRRAANGESGRSLAPFFNIDGSTACRIISRQTWRHL